MTIAPSLGIGAEYRTNVYQSEDTPVGATNARFMPGLTVTAAGPDHEFKLGGDAVLRQFLHVGEPEGGVGPVNRSRLRQLSRNDFNLTAGADLFKQDKVGFVVNERVVLRNNVIDAEYSDNPFTTQFRNRLDGGVRLMPTSALVITPGVLWTYDDFRVAGLQDRRYNARHTIGPQLDARWEFFPRTAMVFDASYRWFQWQDDEVVSQGGEVAVPDSRHIRARLGVDGQLTSRLGVQVAAGYGVALYDGESPQLPGVSDPLPGQTGDVGEDATGLDGLLASLQLQYAIPERGKFFVGYQRDFVDSFFTNFIRYDYVYTGGGLKFGEIEPSVRYGVRFEDYQGAIVRSDVFHRLNMDVAYSPESWLAVTTGAMVQARASNDVRIQYQNWRLHLTAQFTY